MTLFRSISRIFTKAPEQSQSSAAVVEAPKETAAPALGQSEAMRAQLMALQRVSFDALRVPAINPAMLQEMECYTAAELHFQVMFCDHRIRLDLARRLGLAECTMDGAVELLTGRPAKRIQHDTYHNWREVEAGDLPSFAQRMRDMERRIFMSDLPSKPKMDDADERTQSPTWRNGKQVLSFGTMSRLRIPIPAGCVLKAAAVMKMETPYDPKLSQKVDDSLHKVYTQNEGDQRIRTPRPKVFDHTVILAPTECFASPKPKDPAIFAMIRGPWDPTTETCDHRFFLLGRWD